MPTINRRHFIPRAIQCFQRQDYPNIELVIVDNGSDPIGDLLPDDPRVRYSRVPQKLTIGSLRNLACRSAQGEIVAHWDDDDWYPAHRVRTQVQPLIENRADITGTSCLYYYEAAAHADRHPHFHNFLGGMNIPCGTVVKGFDFSASRR